MMFPCLSTGCHAGLAVPLLVFAQTHCAAAAILEPRARPAGGGGDDGDSDSDSDSDGESESCRNGVCTVCSKGVCTTSTEGSKPTSSQNATGGGNGTKTTAVHTTPTGTNTTHSSSVTTGLTGVSNDAIANKGLSKGGIAGLVVGLLIVAGLFVMILLKWRSHRRNLQRRPRGATLLSPETSSNMASLRSGPGSSGSGSEMTESGFSRGVVASAANVIAAANLAAMPPNGYPAPQAYKPLNTDAGGTNTSPASGALPFAKASTSERQDAQLVEIQTHPVDTALLSALPLLPSPHEQTSFALVDVANDVHAPSSAKRQSRALPDVPPSTMHADMVAFQKSLERDNEKTNQPSGSRNAEEPPPVYSD